MNRLQVRELLKTGEYYKRSEVIDFYTQFKNLRAVTGGELVIPEVIVSRIMDILGDYSTLYPIVDRIQVKGTARILIDTDTSAATWVEQNAAFSAFDCGDGLLLFAQPGKRSVEYFSGRFTPDQQTD